MKKVTTQRRTFVLGRSMADSSLMPALIGLGGTIIGSAIVLTSQFLLESKKQAAEKKKMKAEKLQELVSALYEHKHWTLSTLDTLPVSPSKEVVATLPPSPIGRVAAIANIHFSEFDKMIRELDWTSLEYKESKTSSAVYDRTTIVPTYYYHFNVLLDELKDYAKRTFQ